MGSALGDARASASPIRRDGGRGLLQHAWRAEAAYSVANNDQGVRAGTGHPKLPVVALSTARRSPGIAHRRRFGETRP